MRPKIAQIKITEPCSESWEKMTPDDKGKHCAKCEKSVVDFTQMTDNAIVEYLRMNKSTCGRFYEHQVERDFMLFPEISGWRSRLGRVAATALLISQLLPKKAGAKIPVKFNAINSFNHEGVLTDTVISEKTIKGKIAQTDRKEDKALKMLFTIDSFRMEILCDSLKSQEFNFQLPESLNDSVLQVELMTTDTSYFFEINKAERMQLFSGIHSFYFSDGWKHLILSEVLYGQLPGLIIPWPETVLMGVPNVRPIIPEIFPPVFSTYVYGDTRIDTFDLDSPKAIDTAWKVKFRKEKEAFKAGLRREHSWGWAWVGLFVFSLSFLIRWFFTGLENNRRIKNQE